MSRKIGQGMKTQMPEGKVSIRYVKKARMWCKTWFDYSNKGNIIQKQKWTVEKP